MMKSNLLILTLAVIGVFIGGCVSQKSQPYFQPQPPALEKKNVTVSIVAGNLEVPWAIDFLPDGSLIFTERTGNIKLIRNGSVLKIAEIRVARAAEIGLMGVAVHPNFSSNGFVYVYYTYSADGNFINRVTRLTLSDSKLENETIILDQIPGAEIHDGGRIKFGPDGKLYITTGDAGEPILAQDLNPLAGKILRINPDSSIPGDNPYNSAVWSYGHRNPQGIAWRGGRLYASEHGQIRNDEINLIQKGANYGWPLEECTSLQPGFERAISCYDEFTLAPAGIAFRKEKLYVAALRGAQLRELKIGTQGEVLEETVVLEGYGRMRDVILGPDEALYVSTSNRDERGIPALDDDRILRIGFHD